MASTREPCYGFRRQPRATIAAAVANVAMAESAATASEMPTELSSKPVKPWRVASTR
jgi:hypothetical protein